MKRISKRSWSILLQTVPGASRSVCIFSFFLFSSAYAILDMNGVLADSHLRNFHCGSARLLMALSRA